MLSYTSAFVTLLVIVVVVAEPPVRENSKFSRQFENPEPRAFQPILLRPLGGQFVILEQLQAAPQSPVSPPQPQDAELEVNLRDSRRNATEVNTNATESEAREVPGVTKSEKLTNNEDQGTYYIYHPNGLLQKVAYATKDDVEKMAFSARLKYENVEPIREPIYTYDPETYVFKRI